MVTPRDPVLSVKYYQDGPVDLEASSDQAAPGVRLARCDNGYGYHRDGGKKRMKFFLPGITDKDQAEELYADIKRRAQGLEISDKRIFRLAYKDEGKDWIAEVGRIELVDGKELRYGEVVIAILDATVTYLVCTPNLGILRDKPIMVPKNAVKSVEYFED